jgi:hypothetical protein
MPPRFAYWTILAGGLPTAFRAAEREELLPTFNRLKEKQPDAEMKYFARGKLWDSAEEARRSLERERRGEAARPRERRGPDWRPGGAHRDPRQPFKDAKKARNQERRQERWENRHRDEAKPPRQEFRRRPPRERAASGRRAPASKPHGDPFRGEVPPDRGRRPYRPKNAGRGGRSGPPRPDRRGTDERPQRPPRPPGPNREPRPGKEPSPYPPPKPNEPKIETPPPERGRKRRS